MISNRLWRLYRLSRNILVRITLLAMLAVLAAVVAPLFAGYIPDAWAERFGAESLRPILDILTSSMLVVVTFSLSVMVATHRQASSQVTPRSHRLLLEDTTTQTVLATFLGAFIYALVASVLLNASVYSGQGAVIVFFTTVTVFALVVLAILRWIEHLSKLGSMDNTLDRVEAEVRRTLDRHRRYAYLGGNPIKPGAADVPSGLVPVRADKTGYVQNLNMQALQKAAETAEATIYIQRVPGDWISSGETLALISEVHKQAFDTVRNAIAIERMREYDQDARFGLEVLSEIAERALSPGINDSGTAIDVIGRLERVLLTTEPTQIESLAPQYSDLYVPALPESALIESAFGRIARDGAGQIEVAGRLQRALADLMRQRDGEMVEAAHEMAKKAIAYSDGALVLDADKVRLRHSAG